MDYIKGGSVSHSHWAVSLFLPLVSALTGNDQAVSVKLLGVTFCPNLKFDVR